MPFAIQKVIHNNYNMCILPDMYCPHPSVLQPLGFGCAYQANPSYTCYNYYMAVLC